MTWSAVGSSTCALTVTVALRPKPRRRGGQMKFRKSSAGRGVTRHDPQISMPGGYERSESFARGPEARGGESGVPAGQQKTSPNQGAGA